MLYYVDKNKQTKKKQCLLEQTTNIDRILPFLVLYLIDSNLCLMIDSVKNRDLFQT